MKYSYILFHIVQITLPGIVFEQLFWINFPDTIQNMYNNARIFPLEHTALLIPWLLKQL